MKLLTTRQVPPRSRVCIEGQPDVTMGDMVTPPKRASGSPAARRARRTLSEEEVLAAAVRITRRAGVSSLSMRALAEELSVTTMAAYHYVTNKEALLELVAEAVLGAIQLPPEGDWTERFTELHRRLRRTLREYPGLSTYLQERPLTRAGQHMSLASHSMLEEAGFSRRNAKLAAATVQAFLLGRLSMEAAAGSEPTDTTRAREAARRRREDEVFEYGLAAIISGLRTSLGADA